MSEEGTAVSEGNSEAEVFEGGPNSPVDNTAEETTEPKTFDADYVKQLREEAARHRVEKQKEAQRAQELEARLKEFEDAKLSLEERREREFDETKAMASRFQQMATENNLKYQLAVASKTEGIVDVNAAVKLADRELIQTDDAGNITNISDVIAALKGEYVSLFSSAPHAPNTGVTNPPKAASAKKLTRQDVAKLSPEKRVELMERGELNHLLGR